MICINSQGWDVAARRSCLEGTDAVELLSVVYFAQVRRVVFFAEEFECELDTLVSCKRWYNGLYVFVFSTYCRCQPNRAVSTWVGG